MSAPETVADRYRIDSRLGAGGMSTVFRALDTVLERAVAVKLLAEHLADDDAFVARFRREALAAARLQHPNIVQVFDSGRDADSGRHYIVMEYVDGASCADLLRERQLLEIGEAVDVLTDACRGLDYAHRGGVVHRDVKPGNLLVASESGATKLADFGIAKAAEQSRITQVGSILGTAAYLSPEQARGDEAGPPADIYSLGVVAYQLLSGRLPHEYGSISELALKQQSQHVEPISIQRPELPPALDDAVLHCLAPDPQARYASAAELGKALRAGLHGDATEATRALDGMERTQALRWDSEATQAFPATGATGTQVRAPVESWTDSRASAPRPPPRQRERSGGFPLGRLAATVALIVIAAALALAFVSSSGGNGAEAPREPDVDGQVQGLRELIQRNSER